MKKVSEIGIEIGGRIHIITTVHAGLSWLCYMQCDTGQILGTGWRLHARSSTIESVSAFTWAGSFGVNVVNISWDGTKSQRKRPRSNDRLRQIWGASQGTCHQLQAVIKEKFEHSSLHCGRLIWPVGASCVNPSQRLMSTFVDLAAKIITTRLFLAASNTKILLVTSLSLEV